MSFEWETYIALAQELSDRPEEACLRSAVSRAYYAVFCMARNAKGLQHYAAGNLHRKVIEAYRNSTIRKEQEVGWLLDKLRRSKNHADYREDPPVTKAIADRAVQTSKAILSRIGAS